MNKKIKLQNQNWHLLFFCPECTLWIIDWVMAKDMKNKAGFCFLNLALPLPHFPILTEEFYWIWSVFHTSPFQFRFSPMNSQTELLRQNCMSHLTFDMSKAFTLAICIWKYFGNFKKQSIIFPSRIAEMVKNMLLSIYCKFIAEL